MIIERIWWRSLRCTKHKQVARDLGVAVIMRGRMKAIRDQSRLFTSGSKADDQQNWVNVVKEYKKHNEQVARDLGVAGSGSGIHRILSQFTWANVLIPFIDDAIWYVLAVVATSFYYIVTGKERGPEGSEMSDRKESANRKGEGADIWFGDLEGEENDRNTMDENSLFVT
jgi:hypothetical protein